MNIAVIGSGISGLSAAWLLSQRHEVTLYEKSDRLGMDAHAIDIETPGGIARVDVPLRVFFDGFYPNIAALYRQLDIAFEPINYSASFGLLNQTPYFRFDNYRIGRYAVPFFKGRESLNRTALRIGFGNLRLFRALTRALAEGIPDEVTIEDYLDEQGYSAAFADGFLYPAFAGICTCSLERIKAYPARVILEYLNSQLLLSSVQRVTDGTQAVVARLTRRVANVNLGAAVTMVHPVGDGVAVRTASDEQHFDHVVMATQANQTLAMLPTATAEEQSTLGAFEYEGSRVVVHTDTRLAPRGGPARWAPVNFLLSKLSTTPMATIWLNAIQALPGAGPIFQTWNPLIEPDADAVLGEARFERPVVNAASQRGLAELTSLHGEPGRRIWFCGSYADHGIPLLESAATSAMSVAERFGCSAPWVSDGIAPMRLATT